jgi:hypothetical protein
MPKALPLILLLAVACKPDPVEPTPSVQTPAIRPGTHRAEAHRADNPVTHWAEVAANLMTDPGPVIDSRAFAILHAAIHDAVNGIDRRYQPYTADVSAPGASLEAAVATAARDVLLALSPSRAKEIEDAYTVALASIPKGPARAAGVALGHRCARANLDRRADDRVPVGPWPPTRGPITRPVYVPTGKPGDYDFTPPFDAPPLGPIALFPGWGRLEPFALEPGTHRLDGPQPLQSRRYALDFNTLKSLGRLNSSTRTPEQTDIAHFWFEGEPIWTRIAIDAIRRKGLSPWRAARVLVLFHFAVADAGIVCFEAKYHFRFWRPYTAIRKAAEDGNPETSPDPRWRPLLWPAPGDDPGPFLIPPIPDYPSAAAMLSSAAAAVLADHLGDEVSFEASSPTLPGVTRRYRSFTQAAKENGMSRAYGGIHFLHAVRDGYRAGQEIGRDVSRLLPKLPRREP